jgi:V/A-type H+-transporting ATPase subunit K
MRNAKSEWAARLIHRSAVGLFTFLILLTLVCTTRAVFAQGGETAIENSDGTQMPAAGEASVRKWKFLSAAIVMGLGSIAAGMAVAYVGSAALGVIGEKPELATRALIYVGLAEGIAVWGLLIAFMILQN